MKIMDSQRASDEALRISIAYNYIWDTAMKVLPHEVVEDLEGISEKLGGLRMDADMFGTGDGVLRFSLSTTKGQVKFEIKRTAPCSGLAAVNYAA